MNDIVANIRAVQVAAMPEWLKQRLDKAGWIDAATAASRNAGARKCTGCGKPTIRGLTSFPGALSVDCDPQPLSAQAEALCRLTGRRTYELRFSGTRYELDDRDPFRIKGRPAGRTPNVDVLALHVCGVPPPLPWADTMLKEAAWAVIAPEEPPF